MVNYEFILGDTEFDIDILDNLDFKNVLSRFSSCTIEKDFGVIIKELKDKGELTLNKPRTLVTVKNKKLYKKLSDKLAAYFLSSLQPQVELKEEESPEIDLLNQGSILQDNFSSESEEEFKDTNDQFSSPTDQPNQPPKIPNLNKLENFEKLENKMTTEPPMKDLMKSAPKWDSNSKFNSYSRKLKSYLKNMEVTTDSKKINLFEYCTADCDKITTIYDNIKTDNDINGNFDKILEKITSIFDGKIQFSDAELIHQCFELKLNHYSDAKSYFNSFLDIQAKSQSLDAKMVNEAFIKGIQPLSLQNSIKLAEKENATIYDNFKLLEKTYVPSNNVAVNMNRGSFRGGRGRANRNNNWRNYNNPGNYNNYNNNNNNNNNRGGYRGNRGGQRGNWNSNVSRGRRACYLCSKTNHLVKDCPDRDGYRKYKNNFMGYGDEDYQRQPEDQNFDGENNENDM